MNIEYKKDIYNSYMMIQALNPVQQDNFEEKMLLNNSILWIIPFQYRWIDGIEWYCYDITDCRRFMDINLKMGREQILVLIQSIIDAVLVLEEYLLCSDNLLLNPDSIFFNEKCNSLLFVYLPGYGIPLFFQIRELVSEIMNNYMDNKDPEAIVFVYNLYKLSCEESCKLIKIQELLLSCSPGEKEAFGGENCKVEKPHQPVKQAENITEKEIGCNDKIGYMQKMFGKHYGRLLVLDGILLCVGFLFFKEELLRMIKWFGSKLDGFIGLAVTNSFGVAFCIILVILSVLMILGKWIIKNKENIEKWFPGKK